MVESSSDNSNTALKQGKVTGLIYPPPDVRAIVDKTAQFVAKNGRAFEKKIAGEVASGKFSFLALDDPYHAYYEFKVDEFLEGDKEEENPKAEEETTEEAPPQPVAPKAVAVETPVEKAPVEAPVARAALNLPTEAPPPEEFIIAHPDIPALDSEIIKLSAQYTAVNGKAFLTGLATREQRNPQFDFLKPTHALFAYFTALVESYTKILSQEDAEKSAIRKKLVAGTKPMEVLDRCVHRLEWMRIQEEEQAAREANDDDNRLAFQQIDWHDFVIVERIDFADTDQLAAATSLRGDDKTKDNSIEAASEDDMDMEEDDTAYDSSSIRVVKDYVPPQAMTSAASSSSTGAQLMTADGKAVGSDQINEHMRILLMDPKWREENQRRLDKQKETSFASGESIADNLRNFAGKRADIFASSAEEEARLLASQNAAATSSSSTVHGAGYNQQQYSTGYRSSSSSSTTGHGVPPPPQQQQQYPPPGMMVPPPAPGMMAPRTGGAAAPPPPGMMMPPPGVMMPPPPAAPGMMIPDAGGPPSKRLRTGNSSLLSEHDFAVLHAGPVKVLVVVPNDPSSSQWNLQGQTITVEVGVKSTIKQVKEQVVQELGSTLPPNKFQLKAPVVGFVKDSLTLAHYNFESGVMLEMQMKKRGGKR